VPAPEIGVFLPSLGKAGGPPGDMAATARHAEYLGLESVWVVDQLIAGHGVPLLDSGIALAAAATATTRIGLGFGVMILPLRPVAWAAKITASLQYVSGGRVILGVGIGGDRHDQSWDAAGVPRRERGRRTDAALRVLPGLIAGQAVRLAEPDGPQARLSPAAPVPPILVGGMSDAALARAARYGDGWFTMLLPPRELASYKTRLAGLAAEHGRPAPSVTATAMVALEGDPLLPGPETLTRLLTDPDGAYGIPPDQADGALVRGTPAQVADRIAGLAEAGADRIVVDIAAGDWHHQADLLAEACGTLSLPPRSTGLPAAPGPPRVRRAGCTG
jgi:alkanesulfonate monooxygenase SsuD/methylene tetrahydromethanopterin reductase-like flavin-dependent oxidoreductase (luciferase family)